MIRTGFLPVLKEELNGCAMTTAHILLVEDEVKLARFVELELNSEGYQVSVANDGITGLTT